MLDQNTDRMWYVIGAVIIGASIILILNGTAPELFASVADTLKGKTEEVTAITDGIGPKVRSENLLDSKKVRFWGTTPVHYAEDTGTWTLDIASAPHLNRSKGLSAEKGAIEVPYDKTLTIGYEIYIPEGLDGIVAVSDVNNAYVSAPLTDDTPSNDNDNEWSRRYNGNKNDYSTRYTGSPVNLEAGEWNRVWFSYTNNNEDNVNHDALYDWSIFGVVNDTGETIRVQMRNITAYIE